MNIRAWLTAGSIGLTMASLPASFALADTGGPNNSAEIVRAVDYSGRPPFRRRLEQRPLSEVTEFARFEESRTATEPTADDKAGDKLRVVNFRGRPPYRRSVVKVTESDTTEFARFEETSADNDTNNSQRRRSGPPGKSPWLRHR